ncbi:LysR family transcriptional regulator [Gulosibacter molinativorax]|uniref:LysR family transcriptional regulator n=1 Tax=Gulosibacter molinativorax TaxID=256821 RepID=A0ABT7C707_9MICO|nr:LysR family transcriptional regulator [Gulosibacter molinativorax]MDJ1371001.1 LysR family transcriptional regulator [Gulosibacter molinativorax]QUY62795.1 LysR family transcriptional regulator [Gulosibacter molinativorax]
MELRHLKVFLTVADELHFGRAAEVLRMAQPAVSRTVRQFEQELGYDLFNRNTRSVELTPAGEALLEPAQRMVALEQETIRTVRLAAQGISGAVRIAYAGIATIPQMSALARAVRREMPDISLELKSQTYASQGIELLLSNEADLVFGRWDYLPDEVSTHVVSEDALVVAMPTSHPLAEAESVSIAELLDEDWVTLAFSTNSVLPSRLAELFRAQGMNPRIAQEVPDTLSAMSLVMAEVGLSLTLASVRDNFRGSHIAYVPLSDAVARVDLQLAWRGGKESPALTTVIRIAQGLSEPAAEDETQPERG